MADVSDRRNAMVDHQIVARGVRDARVLDAMREVPRERFVPGTLAEFAYEDTPLPIEAGQTISQPYIVALMLEAAKIQPEDRILEIGVGLVAAGGPSVPDPLRRQLAPGGRLVIPIGDADEQRLMRVTRIGKDGFVEDDLGTVRFVPLIGEHGWRNSERRPDDETPAAIERRGFRRDDDSVKNGSWP